MKYSFVLIAYNEQKNIIQCIESIMCQQSLGNSYEILVVDDGSRDTTEQLVTDFSRQHSQVRLLGDGQNHGRGYGRHKGAIESAGDFIIMVDADIVLPRKWLVTALPYMKQYDVAGGIAVPDGDVAYVYRRFSLKPKAVMGTTTITGNNGIYKRSVFDKLSFDPALREGEDVDFNNRALALGLKEYSIPGLTVEHQEHKSFARSMTWLYQSGIGASRQLLRFHEIRLPDIAFAATVLSLLAALIMIITIGIYAVLFVPLAAVMLASFMHLRGKFYMSVNWPLRSAGAILTDSILIVCYYVGRFVGFFVYINHNAAASLPEATAARKS